MDIYLILKAVILGLVEGFTEFLPISSTGHLILVGDLLDFNDDKGKAFEVIIQLGAILAVCLEFRKRILAVCTGLGKNPLANRFVLHVVVASFPAIVLALLFGKYIKAYLFAPIPVACAFIVGGLIIFWAEYLEETKQATGKGSTRKIVDVDDLSIGDAIKVGLAQCAALIPGTSRSGATIIGGMLLGLSRKAATDFSFFLAIPTLIGAGAYSLYKERALLSVEDIPMFATGLVVSFISAWICVRWLLKYIASHSFEIFAWYRIAFGLVVLITAWTGLVSWVP